MPIYVRRGRNKVSYQVKVRSNEDTWITETFDSKDEAETWELETRLLIKRGERSKKSSHRMTVSQFFEEWMTNTNVQKVSPGWMHTRRQMFEDYVERYIGALELRNVKATHITELLNAMSAKGKSAQMMMHVFNLLNGMFKEAVEFFRYISVSPVIRKKHKPELPDVERPHLKPQQVVQLLKAVEGERYALGVWLGTIAGLRIGEIQALKWSHVDFDEGAIIVRSTFRRKEGIIANQPKGKKWKSVDLAPELLTRLKAAHAITQSEFIVPGEDGEMLPYDTYYDALKKYCTKAGVPVVATHGLRHSTAGVWLAYGASTDVLKDVLRHSSSKMAARYTHGNNGQQRKIAQKIQIMGDSELNVPKECSQMGSTQ